jgi:hypothetical protein
VSFARRAVRDVYTAPGYTAPGVRCGMCRGAGCTAREVPRARRARHAMQRM